MAKVTGPLMSMDASGAFGGALVFGKWKGRPTVRKLVTPSNPQSQNQQDARNIVRVFGALQRFFNLTTLKRSGETLTDKAELTSKAPSGQAWNGFLVKSGTGVNAATYAAARAAYAALTAGEKTAWATAAAALTPAIPAVAQVDALGVAGTPIADGEVHFIGQYALAAAGVAPALPTATPPTYA